MNKTVGVVREREREREGELKTDVFSLNIINQKNGNINKRINCLAKVKSRVINEMRVMHNNNICTKLLQNSLSFLRTKSNEYRKINKIKDKYA